MPLASILLVSCYNDVYTAVLCYNAVKNRGKLTIEVLDFVFMTLHFVSNQLK